MHCKEYSLAAAMRIKKQFIHATTFKQLIFVFIHRLKSISIFYAFHQTYPEPETIKICPDCNSTVTVVDGPVEVIDGPVTIQKNFYSGLCLKIELVIVECAKDLERPKYGEKDTSGGFKYGEKRHIQQTQK